MKMKKTEILYLQLFSVWIFVCIYDWKGAAVNSQFNWLIDISRRINVKKKKEIFFCLFVSQIPNLFRWRHASSFAGHEKRVSKNYYVFALFPTYPCAMNTYIDIVICYIKGHCIAWHLYLWWEIFYEGPFLSGKKSFQEYLSSLERCVYKYKSSFAQLERWLHMEFGIWKWNEKFHQFYVRMCVLLFTLRFLPIKITFLLVYIRVVLLLLFLLSCQRHWKAVNTFPIKNYITRWMDRDPNKKLQI